MTQTAGASQDSQIQPGSLESGCRTCDHTTPTPTQMLTGTAKIESTLPNELVELFLVYAIRAVPETLSNPTPLISTILQTLPRASVPSATLAALIRLPELSLESAITQHGVDVDLMERMRVLSHPPYKRFLEWCPATFLESVAERGMIDVLDWWYPHRDTDFKSAYLKAMLYKATVHGQLEVLRWWEAHDLPLAQRVSQTPSIWSAASKHGQVDMLEWWKKVGLPLSVDDSAVDDASTKGHVHVLQWWKEQMGDALCYSHKALAGAIENKHHKVLEWWASSGLKVLGDQATVTHAAVCAGDLLAVEWLYERRLFSFSPTSLPQLFESKDRATIQWVLDRYTILPRHISPPPELWTGASKNGDIDTLELILKFGFPLCHVSVGLEAAAKSGHVHVMDWWCSKLANQLPSVSLNATAVCATTGGYLNVLDWLQAKRLELAQTAIYAPPVASLKECIDKGHVDLIKYWANLDRDHVITTDLLLHAVQRGEMRLFEWMLDGHDFLVPYFYSNSPTIKEAVANGHVEMLKLWHSRAMQSGRLTPDYTMSGELADQFITYACKKGRLDCLQWWFFIHGLQNHANCVLAVRGASAAGHVKILEWLKSMGGICTSFKHYQGFEDASRGGHTHVMDWWLETFGTDLSFDSSACFPLASRLPFNTGHHILQRLAKWWIRAPALRNFVPMEIPNCFLSDRRVPISLIDKLLQSKFTAPKHYSVYDYASGSCHVKLLEYWFQRDEAKTGPKLYSQGAMHSATIHRLTVVLQWWHQKSGQLALKLPFRSMDELRRMDSPVVSPLVLEWWESSGLLPETHPAGAETDDEGDEDEDEDEEAMDEEEDEQDQDLWSEIDSSEEGDNAGEDVEMEDVF